MLQTNNMPKNLWPGQILLIAPNNNLQKTSFSWRIIVEFLNIHNKYLKYLLRLKVLNTVGSTLRTNNLQFLWKISLNRRNLTKGSHRERKVTKLWTFSVRGLRLSPLREWFSKHSSMHLHDSLNWFSPWNLLIASSLLN